MECGYILTNLDVYLQYIDTTIADVVIQY